MSLDNRSQSLYREYLDPKTLAKVEDLELVARWLVEGFRQGLHRSPYVGFSVEFSSHREYIPGDDMRHINWKAYARQDRLYIKEFDAETNVSLHLMVDVSGSMTMATEGVSKLRYAVMLAAGLAHLALSQHDAVGITLYADQIIDHVRPRSSPNQLLEILHPLSRIEDHPGCQSPDVLHDVASLVSGRSLVVLLGDFFFDADKLSPCFDHLRQSGSDVMMVHVLDPVEADLSLDGPIRFRDLETGQTVIAQAQDLRNRYCELITDWKAQLETMCRGHEIDYFPISTTDSLDHGLAHYLAARSEMF